MTPVLFDSHTHLDIGPLAPDVEGVIRRAAAQGVSRMTAVAVVRARSDAERVLAIARRFDAVWAAVGVHPHDADRLDDALLTDLRAAAAQPEVVAVGETGLDYHYMRSEAPVQKAAFRKQLRLAHELGKPVILHLREATTDALEILREEGVPEAGGVVHCYTEGAGFLDEFLAMGLFIGFTGIVTFPKTEALRAAARIVPADRLLVETDAPYLAPVPHRGQTNEAAYVVHTARMLAELRKVSFDVLAEETTRNARRLYGIGGASPDGTSPDAASPDAASPDGASPRAASRKGSASSV